MDAQYVDREVWHEAYIRNRYLKLLILPDMTKFYT